MLRDKLDDQIDSVAKAVSDNAVIRKENQNLQDRVNEQLAALAKRVD